MQRSILFCFLLSIVLGCQTTQEAAIYQYSNNYPKELQQLHQNVINNALQNTDTNSAQELLASMELNGSWADIDYQSQQRGGWPPRDHLTHILEISKAYHTLGNPLYQDTKTSERIHTALNYWLDNDFICPNWWYPVIGVPLVLNPIVLLMEDELSESQTVKALKILNRCEIGKTGQNKVWQSGNVLLTSIFTKDHAMIEKASSSIKEELIVSQNEGIQADWSYHQHGPQLQFGTYGLSYVGDMIKYINILRRTPFAFEESKISILRNYLLAGQQWVIWKDQMNISSCGRQLFIDAQVDKVNRVFNAFDGMVEVDPEFAEQYQNAKDYKTLVGNKHFWQSDYHIHRNAQFSFSVKTCSERVIGAESCNSENIQGYYMGDGASFLYQSGEEYTNIFPFWDWKKIPGTTIHQDKEPLPILTCSGYRIESDFVGGVSNGSNGISTMKYTRNGLEANKSWFMIDDKIVCLGSGISSSEQYPVTTSIDQLHRNGDITLKTNNIVRTTTGIEILNNPTWLLHNNTGYIFPNGGNLTLEAKNVEGSWNNVALRYPDDKIHTDIFKLWFDHGLKPKSESYEYIIVPNSNQKELEEMEVKSPFSIINEEGIQSVTSRNGMTAGISFYGAGASDIMGGIEVNQPCLVLVEKNKSELQLSISDPTHKLSKIQVKVYGHYKNKGARIIGDDSLIELTLPSGAKAGKTTTITLIEMK